jgi:two-component system sensor histidine kinase ChvG
MIRARALFASLNGYFARISIRLLAFNVLLVFLPAAGIFYLNTFEEQLLQAQETSMVQQGRILAAVLSETGTLERETVEPLLDRLNQRTTSRLQVLDRDGWLLADSSALGPRRQTEEEQKSQPGTRESWLYRIGAIPILLRDRLLPPRPPRFSSDYYSPNRPFEGLEVREALAGRYGAATRISPGGQRSVTLYSALPVRHGGEAVGVVLVSQSTFQILQDLYEVRLAIFKVFLATLVVAAVLSLLVSTTIARPLRRLKEETVALLDRRGRLRGAFHRSRRRDEIGDLTHALGELHRRLGQHVSFVESFAGDLAHELKNPLASIRTATEMLREVDEEPTRRRFLAMVEGDVARMEKVLSAAREVAIIDAAIESEERQRVALGELLEQVVDGYRLRLAGRVNVELETPGAPVRVAASEERLAQVFDNLLDNAASFSPPGASIRVRLRCENGTAAVSIEDDGPGIDVEHKDRIFDRFFSYRPRAGKGSGQHIGLGLAIVKAIVEGYGGSVSVRNGARCGSIFEVRLRRETRDLARERT